jgi:cell division protein YceG involved in septum cleavage
MKKNIVTILFMILALGVNGWAQNKFNIDDKVQSHNSCVNVRVNPGTNQTSIGTLYVGDKGTVKDGPSIKLKLESDFLRINL